MTIRMVMKKAIRKEIQSGDSTHSQDHVITLHNFKVIEITSRIVVILVLILIFIFFIFLSFDKFIISDFILFVKSF